MLPLPARRERERYEDEHRKQQPKENTLRNAPITRTPSLRSEESARPARSSRAQSLALSTDTCTSGTSALGNMSSSGLHEPWSAEKKKRMRRSEKTCKRKSKQKKRKLLALARSLTLALFSLAFTLPPP